MRTQLFALSLMAAPPTLTAQVTLDATQDSAATEAILPIVLRLRESLGLPRQHFVVLYWLGAESTAPAAEAVLRILGDGALLAAGFDPDRLCPIDRNGVRVPSCAAGRNDVVLTLSRFPMQKGFVHYQITVAETGPLGGRTAVARSWYVVLKQNADGRGYRLSRGPDRVVF